MNAKRIWIELNQIYARISNFECENCQECCGPINWSLAEDIVIREYMERYGIEYVRWSVKDYIKNNFKCPYAKNGVCVIYPVRPLVCRLFGHTEKLKCAQSRNKNDLSNTEIESMMKDVVMLSAKCVETHTHTHSANVIERGDE
jgi:Fe-S-cluster containining protein